MHINGIWLIVSFPTSNGCWINNQPQIFTKAKISILVIKRWLVPRFGTRLASKQMNALASVSLNPLSEPSEKKAPQTHPLLRVEGHWESSWASIYDLVACSFPLSSKQPRCTALWIFHWAKVFNYLWNAAIAIFKAPFGTAADLLTEIPTLITHWRWTTLVKGMTLEEVALCRWDNL